MGTVLAISSSPAGIANAIFTGITAAALLIGALTGLIPALRRLRRIETLVNGNLTAAKAAELAAMQRELEALREVAKLRIEVGHPADVIAAAEVAHMASRVATLATEVTERRARDQNREEQ